MSVADAAKESQLAALIALRDELAAAIDGAPPTVLPQIVAQFRATLKDIAELGGGGEQAKPKETGLSDFEKRLRERESGAKVSRRSKSG